MSQREWHTRALELARHWPEDAAREVDGSARVHVLDVEIIGTALNSERCVIVRDRTCTT